MKRRLLIGLTLLITSVLSVSFWLVATESGLYWAYQKAQPHLPNSLSVTGLSGKIIGPLTIQEIKYELQSQLVNARKISLSWNPWALLHTSVDVSDLQIESLDIIILESTGSAAEPPSSPSISLPFDFGLDGVKINDINIRRANDLYKIDQISVAATLQTKGLLIKQLMVNSENLNINMTGKIDPVENYPHDIDLSWDATLASGAQIQGQGNITGDIKSTQLSQNLTGAVQMTLGLELQELLTQLSWQSELEVTHIDSALIASILIDNKFPPLMDRLRLTANGDIRSARISGQLQANAPEFGPFKADFKLSSLQGERMFKGISVEALTINAAQGQLSAIGEFGWLPALSWNADISVAGGNPVTLLPQWPGDIEAQLISQGEIKNGKLIASANISQLQGQLRGYPISLKSQLLWKNNGLNISQFEFNSGDTRLNVEGRVSKTLNLRWSLDSDNLAELYPQAQGKLTANGKLSGVRESPTIKASFQADSLQLQDYGLEQLQGKLALDWLKPDDFNFELAGHGADIRGHRIDSFGVFADSTRINANAVAPQANVQLSLNGTLQDKHWRGKLMQANIQTRDYLNWKLKRPSDIDLSTNSVLIDNTCLVSEHDNSHEGGMVNGQERKICNQIEAKDDIWKIGLDVSQLPLKLLADLLPPGLKIKGLADASANLEYHPPEQLQGNVNLKLPPGVATYTLTTDKIEQFKYRFARLEIDLQETDIRATTTLELINGDHFEAQLLLPGANILALDLKTQTLQANARLSAGELGPIDAMVKQIDGLQGSLELDMAASGTLVNPRLKGNATLLDGSLNIPAIKLSLSELNIDAHSENHGKINFHADARTSGGSITLQGDTSLNEAEGWPSQVSLEAKSLDIASLLRRSLPHDTKIGGELNATATLNYKAPHSLIGGVQLFAPSGSISYPLLEGEFEHWPYRDSKLNLLIDEQGISGFSEILIGDGNNIDAQFSLPKAKLLTLNWDSQPVEAKAKLNFNELAIIEALVLDIQQLKGSLALNLSAEGTLAKPRLEASAEITEASAIIPRLGLDINQISLLGVSDNDNQFKFLIEARSGDGRVKIDGSSQLNAATGWPTRLSIKGDNLEISNIPEATVVVSPDLIIELKDRSIHVQGDITIPYAKLQPKDITTAAQVSSDVVIIDSTETAQPEWQVTSQVNLILGDRVNFFGFGFEGRLGGMLLIEEEVGQLTRGTGEIKIPQGRYRAYGQRLDIESGRLLFTGGPLTNPGLDIRAVRKTGNVTSGIQVNGRLKKPQLTLFSIPAMGDTDTLSYLLLGRPMESASDEDGAMMAKAALALGLSGGDQLARRIGDRFGLDEMRIESNDGGDQTSLVVGRYLSPQLYVSYGVGLIGLYNTLNLRYKISDQWLLKAESGESHGADLMYTFEH